MCRLDAGIEGDSNADTEIPGRSEKRPIGQTAGTTVAGTNAADVAAFKKWSEKFKANIVDMGGKLKSGGKVLTTSGVSDGPLVEAKEIIGGFMVVAAESYERAIEVAKECPGVVRPGSSIEIRGIAGP